MAFASVVPEASPLGFTLIKGRAFAADSAYVILSASSWIPGASNASFEQEANSKIAVNKKNIFANGDFDDFIFEKF